MENENKIRSTTVIAVRRNGKVAMAGDGQVTMGNTVMKGNAKKVRRIYDGKVLTGFAGATADAFTLFDKFEEKLKTFNGDLTRAAVELAKLWRTERSMSKLEALLLVAMAYMESSQFSAKEIAQKSLAIAGQICIYTNSNVVVEEL